MAHTATRIYDGYGTVVAYEYRDILIEKSYYADGPSLFVWQINGFGPEYSTEFGTLRAAKAYIDQVKEEK